MPGTSAQICVRVRLFASYREKAGTGHLETHLAGGATVADLLNSLSERLPSLRATPGLVAVNHAYVKADHVLRDDDEVALIPPVSGGSA